MERSCSENERAVREKLNPGPLVLSVSELMLYAPGPGLFKAVLLMFSLRRFSLSNLYDGASKEESLQRLYEPTPGTLFSFAFSLR